MDFTGHIAKIAPGKFYVQDHASGFREDLSNCFLDTLDPGSEIWLDYVITSNVEQRYPNLRFRFAFAAKAKILSCLHNYNQHPARHLDRFICSFNGTPHVSRKLLVAALAKHSWFDKDTCSKNFTFSIDEIDGHIQDFVGSQDRYYRKFIVDKSLADFFQTTIVDMRYTRYDHAHNILNLEIPLCRSFVHVVSESMATSYYPFVSEKFLYSVVTRGFFLAYAQPGWHAHLEKFYGFRQFNQVFDYEFDAHQNPIKRLFALFGGLSMLANLSKHDWSDLYEMESDTIEYNYHHYFSKDYLRHLEKFS